MSFADRFPLVLQMIVFAFAIFITIHAFGRPRKLTLAEHLERNNLICQWNDDPALRVASLRPISNTEFRRLCDSYPAAFAQKEEVND